jgi:hypothetical protein
VLLGRKDFADMRRAGMKVGSSKTKLAQGMLEILIQLPPGSSNLKEAVVARLGLLGEMSPTRDIDEAWKQTKKKAAKDYPDRFLLNDRMVLQWNDGKTVPLDKNISAVNFKKLNHLARRENCSVDKLISTLIKSYEKGICR